MEAVLMKQHIVGRGQPEDARHQAGECHKRWELRRGWCALRMLSRVQAAAGCSRDHFPR